jgi:hypothetical protein
VWEEHCVDQRDDRQLAFAALAFDQRGLGAAREIKQDW